MDSFGRGRVDDDPGGTQAAGQEQLGEGAAERVTDDERRRIERLDDAGQVIDGRRDGQVGDDVGVLAQCFDLDVEPWIRGRDDAVALGFVPRRN